MMKKRDVSVREISKNKEVCIMVWLLIAIGIVLWGGFEIKNTESASNAAVEVLLLENSEDDLIEKYKDNKYFKASIKYNTEELDTVNKELELLDDKDSDRYKYLENESNNLSKNLVRFGLNNAMYNRLMRDTFKVILIVSIIIIVLFGISFILVLLKKYKAFNVITIIEVLVVFGIMFSSSNFFSNITSFSVGLDDSIRFMALIYPILISYLFYVFKKDA